MAQPDAAGRPSSALRRALVPLALAQFICSFAGSNMNVMINDISKDLNTTVQGVQIAITVFLLVMAALMIPGGKLTDRYGRKRCFTAGLVIYGIGALLSAAAPGLGVLIIGNSILEGVGTALLIPPVYILATLLFTGVAARARAFGAISAMGGIGAAAGPLLGGLITAAISWRAAFVFQALIIALIVVLSRRVHDPLPPDPARSFDTGGAILSAVGLILVVTGILAADNNLWLMLALLAAGALVLVWFFAWVRAKERAGKEPLLSTDLFRNRISNLGLVTQGSQWLILMGVSFVVSAYLQVVRHYDAIQTGVIFTAATVGLLASSLAAARLAKRYAQRTLILAGFIVTIAGIGVLLAMVTGISSPKAWVFAPGLLLIGLGLGAMLPVGQHRAIQLRRGAAGRDLRPVAQRVQPRLLPRHRDRRHHPGRGHHLDPGALLRARDDRFGSGRPGRPGGLGIPARGPCPAGRRAASAGEPAPATRDDVSLPPAGRRTGKSRSARPLGAALAGPAFGRPAEPSQRSSTGVHAQLRQYPGYWRGVHEPDVQLERCQPAGQRLIRPAKLLEVAGHLVIAQVRVVAASRADDLILARVAAINMAVDHADGLRPENRGAVIVPGDAVTDRHEVIVHCEQNARSKRHVNFKWLTGYVKANGNEMRSSASRTMSCIAKLIPGGQGTDRNNTSHRELASGRIGPPRPPAAPLVLESVMTGLPGLS